MTSPIMSKASFVKLIAATGITAALVALSAIPAAAQRSKDTVRYSGFLPTKTFDLYFNSGPTTDMLSEAVFDTLITQNLETGEIAPLLAKSWTRVSPTVLEFDLRDDVKWHDGQKFTADDVVATLGWLIDPDTKITYKPNWSWIDKVEKVSDTKVRIVEKAPTPFDLIRLAYYTPIYPKHVFGTMADKTQFGLKPIGTGPYKAVYADINRGFAVERWPDYKWGGVAKPQNNIGRYEVRYIPENGAHLARFVTGETDILHLVSYDAYTQAQSQKPNLPPKLIRSAGFNLIAFPNSGWKMVPALADPRVRKAMIMAIDRAAIEKTRSNESGLVNMLCYENEPGCAQNAVPAAYDPVAAKKLMVEAGYANGFDIEISCPAGGPKPVAEAVAGYLSVIGIRSTITPMVTPAFRQKLFDKKVQVAVYQESSGMIPNSSAEVLPFFMGQIYDDPKLLEMARKTIAETDETARKKATAELLDKAIGESLIAPIQTLARFIIPTEEVELKLGKTTYYTEGFAFRQINWKK